MSDTIREEIEREIAGNTVLVYGKGTKDAPRCGFTHETIEFFKRFGYPFEVVDVLENMPKRDALSQLTDWPTLPKVFIAGKFYGDTDILGPMDEQGELKPLLDEAFAGKTEPKTVIQTPTMIAAARGSDQ
jgi:monothiol glutaredoxin